MCVWLDPARDNQLACGIDDMLVARRDYPGFGDCLDSLAGYPDVEFANSRGRDHLATLDERHVEPPLAIFLG
jgi:hypothetical protein